MKLNLTLNITRHFLGLKISTKILHEFQKLASNTSTSKSNQSANLYQQLDSILEEKKKKSTNLIEYVSNLFSIAILYWLAD